MSKKPSCKQEACNCKQKIHIPTQDISAGQELTCVLLQDEWTVKCWGAGQLDRQSHLPFAAAAAAAAC